METYPNLTEMGVIHPRQIEKFSVSSLAYTDVLRLIYKRPKGSILPESKTFKFPRVQKRVTVEGKPGRAEDVMESNPAFLAVLAELRDITDSKRKKENTASAIIEELRLLEEDIAMRSDYIRQLANSIKKE